jgi:hypothetical protein
MAAVWSSGQLVKSSIGQLVEAKRKAHRAKRSGQSESIAQVVEKSNGRIADSITQELKRLKGLNGRGTGQRAGGRGQLNAE